MSNGVRPDPLTIARKLQGLRVLIVEDSEEDAELMRLIFSAAGASVDVSNGVESAVGRVRKCSYHVVLSDVELGGESGVHLVDSLRQLDGVAIPPVVAVTGHTLEIKLEPLRRAGFAAILSKPVEATSLIETVWESHKGFREPSAAPFPSIPEGDISEVRSKLRARLWESLPSRAEKMGAALRAGDEERLASLCHQLKGTALNCDDASLAGLADELEQKVRNRDTSMELLEAWAQLRKGLFERSPTGSVLAK